MGKGIEVTKRYMPAWLAPAAADVLPVSNASAAARLAAGRRAATMTKEQRRQRARLGGLARAKKCPPSELTAIGKKAGKASMARLTPEQRSEQARRGAAATNAKRWGIKA